MARSRAKTTRLESAGIVMSKYDAGQGVTAGRALLKRMCARAEKKQMARAMERPEPSVRNACREMSIANV